MYTLKQKSYEIGDTVLNIMDPTDYIYFVKNGEVELWVQVEEVEFVIERIG